MQRLTAIEGKLSTSDETKELRKRRGPSVEQARAQSYKIHGRQAYGRPWQAHAPVDTSVIDLRIDRLGGMPKLG